VWGRNSSQAGEKVFFFFAFFPPFYSVLTRDGGLFFCFGPQLCLVRFRVKDRRGEAEVSQWTLGPRGGRRGTQGTFPYPGWNFLVGLFVCCNESRHTISCLEASKLPGSCHTDGMLVWFLSLGSDRRSHLITGQLKCFFYSFDPTNRP